MPKTRTEKPKSSKEPEVSVESELTNAVEADPVAEDNSPVVKAQVAKKKANLVKIKFMEAHEFTIGSQKHAAPKGGTMQVELHVANKLSQRKKAVIIS